MESYAPIIGMVMVSVGSVIVLVGLGALLYANRPRGKGRGKTNAGPSGGSQ